MDRLGYQYDELVSRINHFLNGNNLSFMDVMEAQSDLMALTNLKEAMPSKSSLCRSRLFNSLIDKYGI